MMPLHMQGIAHEILMFHQQPMVWQLQKGYCWQQKHKDFTMSCFEHVTALHKQGIDKHRRCSMLEWKINEVET
jgi:hypothetical protein